MPNDDGYIFYPDGCGALSYFNKTPEKSKFSQPLTLDVYGTEESRNIFAESNNPVAKLPVYGIKNGGAAFLAALTCGETDAQINVNPAISMSPLAINRASFYLIFRRKYTVELAQIKSSKTKDKTATKFTENLLDYDRTIKYFLLSEEGSDYSEMANAYRDYLLSQDILDGKVSNKSNTVLRFFMGTAANSSYHKVVKATSFSDVRDILSDYSEKGVENITAILRGWQTGGYEDNITDYNAEKKFGGSKEYKKLSSYIGQNNKLRLFLEVDPMYARIGKGFFIKGKDTISDGAGSPVTDTEKAKYIFGAEKLKNNFVKSVGKIKPNSSVGMLIDGIGETVFSNLSDSEKFERYEAQQLFEALLKQTADNAGVTGGNLYSLKYCDYIDETSQSTSNSLIEDCEIPWYQMVIHGSLLYTTKTGNSSYDLNLQKLKWIEYGAVPYFEITNENPLALRDTNYTQLFSSQNSEWSEEIEGIYKEFEKELSDTSEGFIVKHEILEDGIVRLRYDNGLSVFINYTDNEYSINGQIIEPSDYCVIKE